jgi:hypothetical protein
MLYDNISMVKIFLCPNHLAAFFEVQAGTGKKEILPEKTHRRKKKHCLSPCKSVMGWKKLGQAKSVQSWVTTWCQ